MRPWTVAERRRGLLWIAAVSPVGLVLVLSLDHHRRLGLDPGALESQVRGQPERCLACHQAEARALEPSHAAEALGCSSCHLGNALSLDKDRAHRGMERFPGDLSTVDRACGATGCHPQAVQRLRRSIMVTARGILSVNRFAFGESASLDGQQEILSLAGTPRSAAEEHARKLCATCHLGTRHRSATQRARGGGCAACHLFPNPSGRAHPQLRLGVTSQACSGCHSRSGRVALSYYGWHEGTARLAGPATPGNATSRQLPDGRVVEQLPPDVHARAALGCLDCHTSVGLMGDGKSYAHKEQQVDVQCEDCHGPGGPRHLAALAAAEENALRINRLLPGGHRPALPDGRAVGDLVPRTRRGTPLLGLQQRLDRRWVLRRRVDGAALAVKPLPGDAAHRLAGHQRLSCQACHTAWSHQCNSCHTRRDPAQRQWDNVAQASTDGAWVEQGGPMLVAEPTLGVDPDQRIRPFIPGMPICLEGRPCRRLFAPADPHTTVRKSRSCASCHQDSLALGLGRGRITFAGGSWRFAPAPRPHGSSSTPIIPPWSDGVPWDGWTSLEGSALAEATRRGARPFTPLELRRILRVGLCLSCHPRYDDTIYRTFSASVARLREHEAPRCRADGAVSSAPGPAAPPPTKEAEP
jgi:hypothetical protein